MLFLASLIGSMIRSRRSTANCKETVYIIFIFKTVQVKLGLTVSCGVSLWRDQGPDIGLPTHAGVSSGGPLVQYCNISLIAFRGQSSLASDFNFRDYLQ